MPDGYKYIDGTTEIYGVSRLVWAANSAGVYNQSDEMMKESYEYNLLILFIVDDERIRPCNWLFINRLQNGLFRIAKRAVLGCETVHFAS